MMCCNWSWYFQVVCQNKCKQSNFCCGSRGLRFFFLNGEEGRTTNEESHQTINICQLYRTSLDYGRELLSYLILKCHTKYKFIYVIFTPYQTDDIFSVLKCNYFRFFFVENCFDDVWLAIVQSSPLIGKTWSLLSVI